MKLTGVRADKRDELLIGSRAGLVDWNVYRKRVQTLERQEKKLIEAKKDRAAARALKEEKKREEKEAKIAANRKAGIEKRKATIAAKKAAAAGGKRVFISKSTAVADAREVYSTFKTFEGKRISFSANVNSENNKRQFNTEIDIDKASKAWGELIMRITSYLQVDSNGAVFFTTSSYVVMNEQQQVAGRRNKQSFKEGEVNCFLAPVIKYLQEKEEEYKTVASKKKIQQVIRRAESLEKNYRDSGVPEDKIEEICKTLGISVSIYDILTNKLNEYNPGKNWKLCFFNTRFNHLDMGHLSVKDTPIELTEEQMFNKVVSLVKSGTWFMTQGKSVFTKQFISWIKDTDHTIIKLKDFPIPALIRCLEGSYKLVDVNETDMMKMDEIIDKRNRSIDGVRYESLVKFLKAGYIVNSKPVFFQEQEAAVGHLDMKKAYAQFKEAGKYYAGFLGNVWKWSKLNKADKTFVENHLGYYKFKIGCIRKNKAFFEKLGLYEGKEYVMFSPEILCLVDMGLSVKILAGAWGSRIDFDFTKEMIDDRGLFRVWSGKLGMDNKDTCFTFYDNQEMAENIKAEHSNVRVYYNEGQIKCFVPKTNQPTYFHIAGAITSYTRINILMKMKELGVDNIVKVMLDGIYTSVPVVEDNLFKVKEMKEHHDAGNSWYFEYSEGVDELCMDWPEFDGISERLTSLEGAGGTGKTHSILKSSYNKVLYVAPTRLLGRKMNKDMGCMWTTLHKLNGIDGENKKVRSWVEEGNPIPHVLFFDERTMCSKDMIEKAISMFPESMILLAGDMEGKQWFQTRFGEGNNLTDIYDTTGWAVKKYETDYRAKDDQLKSLKVALRDLMRKCFTDGGRSDATVIESWLASRVNVVGFFDAVEMFNNGSDFWISPKNEDSDRLINNNVISGYRVKHSTREYSKGEALNEDVGTCCEKRGSFTVHSTQGLTISNGKLFISMYGSFEYSMLYTAISRAVHFDQLVFVGK